MARAISQLSRKAASLVGSAIGRAIDWYTSRGYPFSAIINKLIDRGFIETRANINQLIGYSASKLVAGQRINRLASTTKINVSDLPTASSNPSKVRVKYRINIEEGDTEKDTFGYLFADCDDGLTKEELLDCINQAADNFLNYFDYDVQKYTVDIEDMSAF
jgi:hypothetical protein